MQKRRILIFTKVEHTARRQIVHGIGLYAHQKDWQLLIPWADLDNWAVPRRMEFDGLIAFPHTRREINFLENLRTPVVCLGPHFAESALPRVEWNDVQAGRLAIHHLAERGLKNISFIGADHSLNYVARRLKGALAESKKLGLNIDWLDLEPRGHQSGSEAAISKRARQWLRSCHFPRGLVAATDSTGLALIDALEAADIAVPEAAAVVTIGGDNLLCSFGAQALTSVDLPGEQVGFEAARLLGRLMNQENSQPNILVPPYSVTCRRSSEMIATNDEIVRQAIQFIHAHATQAIGVQDVVNAIPLSRRPLELRFKKAVGRTLQKEIWRVRLERAKKMLSETDMSIAEIADRCGFIEPQRMAEVFRRESNSTPTSYRRSSRLLKHPVRH